MAIKQHLGKNVLLLQSIQEKIYQLFFPQFRSTKHLVDQVSANYNGYYRQESSKSDKYGFSGACLRSFNEVRHVFKILHKILASKFQI